MMLRKTSNTQPDDQPAMSHRKFQKPRVCAVNITAKICESSLEEPLSGTMGLSAAEPSKIPSFDRFLSPQYFMQYRIRSPSVSSAGISSYFCRVFFGLWFLDQRAASIGVKVNETSQRNADGERSRQTETTT
jgi:hypothetical protein